MSTRAVTLVGLVVLVGSSVPFVPTGEVVSAAAALAGSVPLLLAVLVVVVLASVAGDSVMLLGVRGLARISQRRASAAGTAEPRGLPARVDGWMRRLGGSVRDNAFTAVVTGRLVPGGRAPVIVALALQRYPLHRFVGADLVACAAWASVYVALGALGGRTSGHPLLGTVAAVVAAVALGVGLQLVGAHRRSHARLTAPGGSRRPAR